MCVLGISGLVFVLLLVEYVLVRNTSWMSSRTHSIDREHILSIENTFCSIYREHILSIQVRNTSSMATSVANVFKDTFYR